VGKLGFKLKLPIHKKVFQRYSEDNKWVYLSSNSSWRDLVSVMDITLFHDSCFETLIMCSKHRPNEGHN